MERTDGANYSFIAKATHAGGNTSAASSTLAFETAFTKYTGDLRGRASGD